jgi:ABC-type transporter Mla MlaB component
MLPMETTCARQGEMVLGGELTIRRVAEIREMLLESIGRNASTAVRIRQAAAVDPAFLQLLCSAHRTAVGAGKCLSLEAESSSLFRQQLADAGFVRHTGCLHDCQGSCIWAAAESR